jgi:hypothetical protein
LRTNIAHYVGSGEVAVGVDVDIIAFAGEVGEADGAMDVEAGGGNQCADTELAFGIEDGMINNISVDVDGRKFYCTGEMVGIFDDDAFEFDGCNNFVTCPRVNAVVFRFCERMQIIHEAKLCVCLGVGKDKSFFNRRLNVGFDQLESDRNKLIRRHFVFAFDDEKVFAVDMDFVLVGDFFQMQGSEQDSGCDFYFVLQIPFSHFPVVFVIYTKLIGFVDKQ